MSVETQPLALLSTPSIFTLVLVYADTTKNRWAWYCLFPVLVLADCFIVFEVCQLGILIFWWKLWPIPVFPGFQVILGTLLVLGILGGFTASLWRQKRKWDR